MGVKVTGQFEPAGDFSIVDGKDVEGNITGSNVSASGQLEAGSLGTNLASIISGSTPFGAFDVSGSWRGELSSSTMTVVGGGVTGSSTSTGSFGRVLSETLNTTGNADIGGNLTITGNYTVNGTTTFISSSQLDIGDNIIHLNSVSPVRYAGIHVRDIISTTNTGSMVWDATNDYWLAGQSGSEYRVPLQDSTSNLTDNTIVIAQGNGRLESGNITDNGSNITMSLPVTASSNLEVVGNISGSSTSTGSFGRVEVAGSGSITGDLNVGNRIRPSGDIIPTSDNALRLGVAAGYGAWKEIHGYQINLTGATLTGENGGDIHIKGNGSSNYQLFVSRAGGGGGVGIYTNTPRSNTLHVAASSGIFVENNISGSSTSLGSFGSVYAATHITASGNISASGTIYADNFQSAGGDSAGISFTDDFVLTGNMTASGDISGSYTSTGSFGHLKLGNADTDASFEFGRAHVGHIGYSDMAGFSHVDLDATTTFALAQSAAGKTIVNAASGQQIALKINNADKVSIDATGLSIGTDTPAHPLHVVGNAFFTGNISGSAASTGSFAKLRLSDSLEVNTTPSATAVIHSGGDNGAGTGNTLKIQTGTKNLSYASYIELEPNSSGNIVINPRADELELHGRLNFYETYDISTSGFNDLSLTTRDGSTPWTGYGDSAQIIVGTNTNAGIKLYTHGTGTVYISGSSAGDKLEVVGGIKATGNISGSSTSTGSFGRLNVSSFSSTTATIISGSTNPTSVSGSWRGEFSSSAVKVVGGGVSGSSTSTGSFARVEAHGGLHIPTVGSQPNGILFGDGDTGFYENADDDFYFKRGGNTVFRANTSSGLDFGVSNLFYNQTGGFWINSPAGSAAAPNYVFRGDQDTGMFRIDADRLGFSTGGTLQLEISSNKISGSATSTGSFGRVSTTTGIVGAGDVSQTARSNADDLVINNATTDGVGISILGNDSYFKSINFGGANSDRDAVISYSSTSDNKMTIGTTRASGIINFVTGNGDVSLQLSGGASGVISGSATSTGSFGQVKVGSSTIKSSIISSGGGFDLGAVGSSASKLRFDGDGMMIRGDGSGNMTFTLNNDFIIKKESGHVRLTVDEYKVSGSSTSTGSFGAVSIGKATSDSNRALTVVGNAQFDNDAKIYFKRSTGTADPYISYDSSDNFKIFNPLSGEIQLFIGSGEIVAVDSSGLTLNGSKTIGSNAGSGVITVAGNSGLKLKSGAGGGSGPIEFIQGSTTYFSIGANGVLTGSADLVMDPGKHISGSSTSTGSFGRLEIDGIVSASGYQGQIGSRYVHSQTSDSETWNIQHNLGHKYPVATIYDSSDRMILPESATASDSDNFVLTFNEAIQGTAILSIGGVGNNAGNNYIHTQSDSSTNWRVTHSLSQQYPNVTVFDENNEVILPETITATSENHADIVFSSGKSGYANFSIGSGIPNISSGNAGKFLKVRADGEGVEWVPTTANVSGSMSVSGSITPDADDTYDLGSSSKRWANLFTGDLQLSNEGSEGNEVDGTTGSWTIQEGEESLYLLNRKNGKKYRFKLEEIT